MRSKKRPWIQNPRCRGSLRGGSEDRGSTPAFEALDADLAILLNSLDVVTAFMWCSILLVVGFLAACVLMRSQRESVESSDGSDSLIDNASDADA